MRKSTIKLITPLLALLVPLVLLVSLGIEYMGLVESDRRRYLQNRADLLLEGQENGLSLRLEEIASLALNNLPWPQKEQGDERPGLNQLKETLQRCEESPYIAGLFLLFKRGDFSRILFPQPGRIFTLGMDNAEFPFEALPAPFQSRWLAVKTRVDTYLQIPAFDWALEEIKKAKKDTRRNNRSYLAFLSYLEASVLKQQGKKVEAQMIFLRLAKELEQNQPQRKPQREILLCKLEAALLSQPDNRKKELTQLARAIATGKYNNTPEAFLRFLFYQKIIPRLEKTSAGKKQPALLEQIKTKEKKRESKRQFQIMLYGAKSKIFNHLARNQEEAWNSTLFLHHKNQGEPIVFAFRAQRVANRTYVAGLALDLRQVAADHLRVLTLDSPREEGLVISLRTPHNEPVLSPYSNKDNQENPPLIIRNLKHPLKGFRLQVTMENPGAEKSRLTGNRLKLGLYLAGLGLIAGTGILLLLLTTRRQMELAQMKSDFISRVTHDLKTPLALIRLYGETISLGRVAKPAEAEKYGRIITTECDTLTTMIDKVLTFSRIERGMFTYNRIEESIHNEVANIVESFRPAAEQRQIKLEEQLEPTPLVSFDREGLRRALLNLLDNAAKFGDGSILVTLNEEGEFVSLAVSDRGPGIPEDELEAIFTPFRRGREACEKRGSGLGLALVRHFAQGHDGNIQALPREGGGITMKMTLPAINQKEC